MLTMECTIVLLLTVFVGEMVWTFPQFGGGPFGMQQQGGAQPIMAATDGAPQPIMPVNGAGLFGAYGMQQQYAQQQQMPQMVSRYGNTGGFQQQQSPQLNDIYQQQQLMQQMMMQQQRLQQIRPVANYQPSFGQSVQGFVSPQPPNYRPGIPHMQAIQPAGPPASPANIPMQVVVGRQLPTGPNAVAYGSNTQTSFQTEDQVVPSSTTPPPNSELPKFLEGAGLEVVDEFKHIIRQPNTSYSEQVKQIDGLVQKLDEPHQQLYRQFMKENDYREQQHRDKIHQTVANMSDKAQEQFAKISAVLRNPGVPDQERWDRVLTLYGNMDPELRNEFEQKFKGFGPTSPNYFI